MWLLYKGILFLKWSFSIFEIFVWFFTIIFWYEKIQSLISWTAQRELKEDPNDFIVWKILDISQSIYTNSELLFAWYIIIEWCMKLILIYGVYTDKKKIFPFAFLVFWALFLYEIFLLLNGHSFYISILAVLDALLLWVIYKEYSRLLSQEK